MTPDAARSHSPWLVIGVFMALGVCKVALARWLAFGDANVARLLVLEIPPVMLLVTAVALVSARRRFGALFALDAALSVMLFSMVVYAAYHGRMPVPHSLVFLGQVGAVSDNIAGLLSPVQLLFFADLPVLAAWRVRAGGHAFAGLTPVRTLAAMLAVSLAFFGVHVGVGLADEPTARAMLGAKRGLFAQQVVEGVAGSRTASVDDIDIADPEAVQALIADLKGVAPVPSDADGVPELFGVAEGRHVIVVLFESLQPFAIGATMGDAQVTPALDTLLEEAFYWPNMYFQMGPGNTSDAEYIIHTSLYPLEFQAVSAAFGDRKIPSMPRLLGEHGYTTLTFHANDVTFWNRDDLYPALGFDVIYDLDHFDDSEIIMMGPSDDMLYETTAEVLAERHAAGELLYASVLTLTSHTPFEMPENRIPFELSAELDDTGFGRYLESVGYADRALGRFVASLEEAGVLEESVLVIVGDHLGPQYRHMTAPERELMDAILGRPHEWPDRLTVPMLVVAPGITDARVFDQPSGHVDIMPTLANLLGVPLVDHVHFGQDLLNPTAQLLGIRYYEPLGTYIDDEAIFRPGDAPDRPTAAWHPVTRDPLPDPEYHGRRDAVARVVELQRLSDAYLEFLPRR